MRRVLIPPALPPLGPAAPRGRIVGLAGTATGTSWSVRVVVPDDRDGDGLRPGIAALLDGIEDEMNRWRPGADLCRYPRGDEHRDAGDAGPGPRPPIRMTAAHGIFFGNSAFLPSIIRQITDHSRFMRASSGITLHEARARNAAGRPEPAPS
ncbi:MAG: hypothetical protein PGN34_19315 [Methylobacterium frigidaeris]